MKFKESFLNIREKYDNMMGIARDLKNDVIDEIADRLTKTGESKAAYISSMYIAEKGCKPETAILCNLKINKVMRIGKTKIMIVSTDHDMNEYENDIKELTLKECMNVLIALNTDGCCRPIPLLDMVAKEEKEEIEEELTGPGTDIITEEE